MASQIQMKFGIIGDPVAHSASPPMHQAAYDQLGISAEYQRYPVKTEQLEERLDALVTEGVLGINVTIPHKESVMPFLDKIDPFAQEMGAVNTILFKDGEKIGYNTDAPGFLEAVSSQLKLSWKEKTIALLGAGGSAKALATVICREAPRAVHIFNRSTEKAIQLADTLQKSEACTVTGHGLSDTNLSELITSADIIINTTSVGMGDMVGQSPLPETVFQPHHAVIDIIYTPNETQLLADAKAAGARTLNGLSMLAGQGALAFKLFTGQDISSNFMLHALENHYT